jgi:hypothetical protein
MHSTLAYCVSDITGQFVPSGVHAIHYSLHPARLASGLHRRLYGHMPITGGSGAPHLDLRIFVLERICRQASTTRFSNAREAANVTKLTRAQRGDCARVNLHEPFRLAHAPTNHASWQLQDRRDALQPHALGAVTLRSASSRRRTACRTDTTPHPTTRP